MLPGLELLTRVLQRGHLRVQVGSGLLRLQSVEGYLFHSLMLLQDALAAAATWETTRKPASAEAATEGFQSLLGRATERFVVHKKASEPVSEVSTLLSGDSSAMNISLSHCACVLSPLVGFL